MTVSEAYIERKVCARARENGWLERKFSSPGRRGVPDRFFLRDGRVLFIEFKAPGKRLSALQARTRQQFIFNGAEYHVVDNLEDGYAAVA